MLLGGFIVARDSHHKGFGGHGGCLGFGRCVGWGTEVILGRVASPEAGQIEGGNDLHTDLRSL